MDGFSRDQWNNIDGMVYFILFDGTEQSCWAYLCTFQPRAQYGGLPKLRETVDKIYDSRPSLAALLSSAHRISARFTVSSCVHSQGLYSLYSASVVLLINYLRLHRELLTLGYSSLFVCLFVCLFVSSSVLLRSVAFLGRRSATAGWEYRLSKTHSTNR